ncbi:multiple sugar transport system permease protein [Inquilinus ginsengisoli]|uniref:Maltose/maltodextrin transport system permease protein MalG n=1 Tax=Inquilinus ginsengisoli TaxID=363840 RepID=A0ABU1JPC3_9PROT|nr:carbohydrate ABC transporter permease [Inquilinus ginsengisoli]MDR6290470.1 multiple sugar transport system permease protein [Inquilinus ginsengisoli]
MRMSLPGRIAAYAAMYLVGIVILVPVLWLLVMSVSSTRDLTTLPLAWIPSELDFSRYTRLLTISSNGDGAAFLAALRNTCLVALGTTVLAFLLAIPAAWVFSRYPKRYSWMLYLIVATYMLPPLMFVVPLYRILSSFDLLNSPWALMIADCTIVLPFTTWLLKSGIDNIPVDLEEAARIDGARLWQILLRVTLPLARPVIGTTLLFSALIVWDEFLYAMLFTSDSRAQTLTVVIANLASGRVSDYGLLATAGVIAAAPPVLVGLLLQRSIVSGLTSGSVKG